MHLRHAATGQRVRFLHRPASNHLPRGARVLLRALLLILLAIPPIGCGRPSAASLPFAQVNVWPIPPDHASLPAPRSVASGVHDEIVVLDTAGRVLVYGRDGTIKRQWFMPEITNGRPEGVCVLRDGRIVVCDTHYHRVLVFDPTGNVVLDFGREGRGPGEFIYPVAVTTDPDENLFVAEYGSNDRIQKFTHDGKFLSSFGGFGTAPGEFQRPSGIAWLAGKMYVADAFNNRIQVFSAEGKYERILESPAEPWTLHFPYDLKTGPADTLYVVEYGAGRVTQLTTAGTLLGRYGQSGSDLGEFATPWGLAVTDDGHVIVADTGNRRLVELTP